MKIKVFFFIFAVLICAAISGEAAQPIFTTMDAPGAGTEPPHGSYPQGINPAGMITGYYISDDHVFHGFVRSN